MREVQAVLLILLGLDWLRERGRRHERDRTRHRGYLCLCRPVLCRVPLLDAT